MDYSPVTCPCSKCMATKSKSISDEIFKSPIKKKSNQKKKSQCDTETDEDSYSEYSLPNVPVSDDAFLSIRCNVRKKRSQAVSKRKSDYCPEDKPKDKQRDKSKKCGCLKAKSDEGITRFAKLLADFVKNLTQQEEPLSRFQDNPSSPADIKNRYEAIGRCMDNYIREMIPTNNNASDTENQPSCNESSTFRASLKPKKRKKARKKKKFTGNTCKCDCSNRQAQPTWNNSTKLSDDQIGKRVNFKKSQCQKYMTAKDMLEWYDDILNRKCNDGDKAFQVSENESTLAFDEGTQSAPKSASHSKESQSAPISASNSNENIAINNLLNSNSEDDFKNSPIEDNLNHELNSRSLSTSKNHSIVKQTIDNSEQQSKHTPKVRLSNYPSLLNKKIKTTDKNGNDEILK